MTDDRQVDSLPKVRQKSRRATVDIEPMQLIKMIVELQDGNAGSVSVWFDRIHPVYVALMVVVIMLWSKVATAPLIILTR